MVVEKIVKALQQAGLIICVINCNLDASSSHTNGLFDDVALLHSISVVNPDNSSDQIEDDDLVHQVEFEPLDSPSPAFIEASRKRKRDEMSAIHPQDFFALMHKEIELLEQPFISEFESNLKLKPRGKKMSVDNAARLLKRLEKFDNAVHPEKAPSINFLCRLFKEEPIRMQYILSELREKGAGIKERAAISRQQEKNENDKFKRCLDAIKKPIDCKNEFTNKFIADNLFVSEKLVEEVREGLLGNVTFSTKKINRPKKIKVPYKETITEDDKKRLLLRAKMSNQSSYVLSILFDKTITQIYKHLAYFRNKKGELSVKKRRTSKGNSFDEDKNIIKNAKEAVKKAISYSVDLTNKVIADKLFLSEGFVQKVRDEM